MTRQPPTAPPANNAPNQEMFARIVESLRFVPQARALGLEITRVERARAWGRAPFREDLVGDPDHGVIAGGVVTTLLDQLCGAAAVAALEAPLTVATIDLRIDYMRPAAKGRDILADAHCYKLARSVAFVRAIAYEDSADDPVAHATAAFMLNSSAGRGPGANLAPAGAKKARR
jgi:uncharacterized protein (TIGR00369 family)